MTLNDMFTKKNAYLIVIFLSASLFGIDYDMFYGFFPHVAPEKNVSSILNGLLYSEYSLIILVVYPIGGKLAPIIGGERILYIGALILGFSSISFGLTYFLPAGNPFIIAIFISRAFSSIGASFGCVVTPALIATLGDNDKVCTLIATLESVITGGLLIGPTLGSVLFKYGGFFCPFLVMGIILLILGITVLISFPSFKSTTVVNGQISIFITSLNFWINISALLAVEFTVGFQSACFFLYCKDKFHMSPVISSLAYLGDAISYITLSPLVGMLNDTFPNFLPYSVVSGLLLISLAFLFMGPLPLIGITPHIALSVTSTIIFGCGYSLVYSPVFTQLWNIALYSGLHDDFKTFSIVSSCHGFFAFLGLSLGPTIGVFMYKHIGYGYSCGIISLIMVLVAIVTLSNVFVKRILNINCDDCFNQKNSNISNDVQFYECKSISCHHLNMKTLETETSTQLGSEKELIE